MGVILPSLGLPPVPARASAIPANPSNSASPSIGQAPGLSDDAINKISGMAALRQRLQKLNLPLDKLGLTPDKLRQMVADDPEGAVKKINRRIDALEVHAQNANRGHVPTKKRLDPGHQEVGPEETPSRVEAMGDTPKRDGPKGRQVQERMRREGKLRGEGKSREIYDEETKTWVPFDETDVGHRGRAASKAWNDEGYLHGAQSPKARELMTNPDGLEFEPRGANRGKKDGEVYRTPHPDPISEEELKGQIKPRNSQNEPLKSTSAEDLNVPGDVEQRAAALADRAKKSKAKADSIDARAGKLEERSRDLSDGVKSGKLEPQDFDTKRLALEKELKGLDAERKALSGELKAVQREAESVVTSLQKAAPSEMEVAFKGRSAEEVLSSGRTPSGLGQSALKVLGWAMTAYEVVTDVGYVLQADSFKEGVARTLETGGRLALNYAETELVAYLAGVSSATAGALLFLAFLPSDQNTDKEDLRKAEEVRLKEEERLEMMAVGKYLEKAAPTKVFWVEDRFVIRDKALWNKTVQNFRSLKADDEAKAFAELRTAAFKMGQEDGKSGADKKRVHEIATWTEVKQSKDPVSANRILATDYGRGREEAAAVQQRLFDAAKENFDRASKPKTLGPAIRK